MQEVERLGVVCVYVRRKGFEIYIEGLIKQKQNLDQYYITSIKEYNTLNDVQIQNCTSRSTFNILYIFCCYYNTQTYL